MAERDWIGVVLAALGEHIRRLEDDRRELMQTNEYLWEKLKERELGDGSDVEDNGAVEHPVGEGLLDRAGAVRGEDDRERG